VQSEFRCSVMGYYSMSEGASQLGFIFSLPVSL
jgi:hypothetical protein